jgi:hypothetical protein
MFLSNADKLLPTTHHLPESIATFFGILDTSHPKERIHTVVLENRIMMKTSGYKTEEVKLEWRKLHEELNTLYSFNSSLVMKSMRYGGA